MKHRILIVEDDEAMRQMLGETLAARGFDVLTAGTVHAAIKCLEDRLDAVLTDLEIADESGLEVCRAVTRRNRESERKVLVWLMTGTDVPGLVRDALAAGACAVWPKPFTLDAICTSFEHTLGKPRISTCPASEPAICAPE